MMCVSDEYDINIAAWCVIKNKNKQIDPIWVDLVLG